MGEAESIRGSSSNFRGDTSVTRKIRADDERISFRDFARFALPRKTSVALAHKTGSDERTVKRWLAGRSKPSERAVRVLLGEIIRKLD